MPRDSRPTTSSPSTSDQLAHLLDGKSISEVASEQVHKLAPDAPDDLMVVGLNLIRASSRYVQAAEGASLREHDLRWASFSVLFWISAFPGIEARNISKLTGVTRQATSQVLNSLEKSGHITRTQADSADKRLLEVRLTPKGQQVVSATMASHMEMSADWFAPLTPDERRQLNQLLRKLVRSKHVED